MEVAHVESLSLPLTQAFTHRADLGCSDHEAAGLSRIDAIAIDLALRRCRLLADVLDHPANRLLARPAMMMNAGIDDDARRAEQLRLQQADTTRRIVVVHAELVGNTLRIKRPPFRVRRE